MSKVESLNTLKLELSRVAWYIGNLLSALLGRQIECTAQAEDDGYWSVAAVNDRFTNAEIISLINYVEGDASMIRHCIPTDSNSSRSLGMDLCEALLKHILKLQWDQEFVTQDALWLIGRWPTVPQMPRFDDDLIFMDFGVIDCKRLLLMADFVARLFENGGTYSALTNLCEEYETAFGNALHWMHPYTDGLYNGCYFVLVQEGILVLSYDAIDWQEHEVFERESARLCTAEEMRNFAHEYRRQTIEMQNSLEAMLFFLERREEQIHG